MDKQKIFKYLSVVLWALYSWTLLISVMGLVDLFSAKEGPRTFQYFIMLPTISLGIAIYIIWRASTSLVPFYVWLLTLSGVAILSGVGADYSMFTLLNQLVIVIPSIGLILLMRKRGPFQNSEEWKKFFFASFLFGVIIVIAGFAASISCLIWGNCSLSVGTGPL